MKKEEIRSKVFNIVEETLCVGIEEIKEDSIIANDLGADSLDAVEIIMNCEREFNICIPDNEAEKVSTVGDLIVFIEKTFSK